MDNFKGIRVFVSGGAGVIGSVLVEKLHQAGAKLLVGDLKSPPKNLPKDVSYWHGDLNNITSKELMDFAPQIYFHLAATFERTEETPEFWKENYHHNIQLSHHLIDILKDCASLQRIVFASSYLIYDPLQYLNKSKSVLLGESSSINPRNLCGMAKLLHEKELEFIHSKSSVSARIFRVYGKNSRDIISRWIQCLRRGETITVYGKEGSFDYILADDVAEGLMRLSKTDYIGHINLGTGSSRKIKEVLDILHQHFPDMKTKEENSPIQYENSAADMSLFKQVAGWQPQHTLEKGIDSIME